MKHLPLTALVFATGFIIGEVDAPVQAEVPNELIYSMRMALNEAFDEGKQARLDDIGLVRLTIDDVEELVR